MKQIIVFTTYSSFPCTEKQYVIAPSNCFQDAVASTVRIPSYSRDDFTFVYNFLLLLCIYFSTLSRLLPFYPVFQVYRMEEIVLSAVFCYSILRRSEWHLKCLCEILNSLEETNLLQRLLVNFLLTMLSFLLIS